MPEGPELFLASQFVNRVGQSHVFTGKVIKSEVSVKNPDVDWDEKSYKISATSRGKEVKLILTSHQEILDKNEAKQPRIKTEKLGEINKTLSIVFRFGMSGVFKFEPVNQIHKHAHLNFYTENGKVLSFVDVRRFGRWEVGGDWGPERGPCVLQESQLFRENVLKSLKSAAFNKPICEAMLNQKYFNGIGNYLRAEILYRGKVKPFDQARSVLEQLQDTEETKVKSENSDFLQLCHTIPQEVIHLEGKGYDPEAGNNDYSDFRAWLRCYYNPSMKNMVDHNGRTIWYDGEAGTMVPKQIKSKGRKATSPKKDKELKITSDKVKVKELADHDDSQKSKRLRTKSAATRSSNSKLNKAKQVLNNSRKRSINKNTDKDVITPNKIKKETEEKEVKKRVKKETIPSLGSRRSSRLKAK